MTMRSNEPVRGTPMSEESLKHVGESYSAEVCSLERRIKAHEGNNFGKPLALALSVLPKSEKICEAFKTDSQGVSAIVSWSQLALNLARIRKLSFDALQAEMKKEDSMFEQIEREVAINAIEIVFRNTFLSLQSRRASISKGLRRQRVKPMQDLIP